MPKAKAEQLAVVKRAALYIRVSTDEQARKGYSLPAQQEALESYAKQNGYAVAGLYVDDGVSAHQKYTKRKGLMRLLGDVEEGKVDAILFIKLDRWFRSIKEYYKVQEILDAHRVTWAAILEDYETETSQGKMVTNIMLAVAQAESDRTSDRIKFVFESKVARGEVITGNTPLGYKIENKRLVPDGNAEAVREMFRHYCNGGSIQSTMNYMRNTYGFSLHPHSAKYILSNPIYIGEYRGNVNYCEPILKEEEYRAAQEHMKSRSIRKNQTGRVYLFSGLLKCAECKHAMAACFTSRGEFTSSHIYYRCHKHNIYRNCTHSRTLKESELEDWLFSNMNAKLEEEGEQLRIQVQTQQGGRPRETREAILRKLDNLKTLFVEDLITLEQYRIDYSKYQIKLDELTEAAPDPTPDYERIKKLLSGDYRTAYTELSREQKRQFWRNIIKKIEIDNQNVPQIYFAFLYTNRQ